VLFPDRDPAGDTWTKPGGFASELQRRGHRVRIAQIQDSEAKDLNDLLRKKLITPDLVSQWTLQS
jgi:hypothetical protein